MDNSTRPETVSGLIDRLASTLGVAQETRWKWWQRGCVPHRWRLPIATAARLEGKELTEDELANLPPRKESAA